LEKAYDMQPLKQQGLDGSGQTIVFWEVGDGYDPSDLQTFDNHFDLPDPQITTVGPSQKQQGELIMDLETVHSLAPGARLVVYTSSPRTESAQDALLQQMLQQHPGAIFSYSWGGCELADSNPSFWVNAFQQAASEGSTVIAAAGDSGGYDCMQPDATGPTKSGIGVSLPASSPYVLAVGGTRLSLNTNGGYYDETPWNYAIANEGTGGGISKLFKAPSWQKAAHRDRWSMRTVPDVAAIADPETGLLNFSDGSWSQGGGTSLATPIWVALTALIDEYLQKQGLKPLGLDSQALYALAAGSPKLPPFHDITVGGNMVYNAFTGYDLVSGVGSPNAWNLAQDLAQYEKNGGRV
ncbi:MAG: S53 family peptidase, partial [Candidatus Dormibacteraceae bacterium]